MNYREAVIADIRQIQFVRNAVKENMLSDPALVSDKDCEDYMTIRGKAWVCEQDGKIVGFSYVDVLENNIWALFVLPDHAEKGIGKTLHKLMLDWYFANYENSLWLGTAPGTRAEIFYQMQGWTTAGMHGKEVKFEMKKENWLQKHNHN